MPREDRGERQPTVPGVKRKVHRWTTAERHMIFLALTEFNLSHRNAADVFNHHYAAGFERPLDGDRIADEYRSRNATGRGAMWNQEIVRATYTAQQEQERVAARQKIRDAAVALNIALTPAGSVTVPIAPPPIRNAPATPSRVDSVMGGGDEDDTLDERNEEPWSKEEKVVEEQKQGNDRIKDQSEHEAPPASKKRARSSPLSDDEIVDVTTSHIDDSNVLPSTKGGHMSPVTASGKTSAQSHQPLKHRRLDGVQDSVRTKLIEKQSERIPTPIVSQPTAMREPTFSIDLLMSVGNGPSEVTTTASEQDLNNGSRLLALLDADSIYDFE